FFRLSRSLLTSRSVNLQHIANSIENINQRILTDIKAQHFSNFIVPSVWHLSVRIDLRKLLVNLLHSELQIIVNSHFISQPIVGFSRGLRFGTKCTITV